MTSWRISSIMEDLCDDNDALEEGLDWCGEAELEGFSIVYTIGLSRRWSLLEPGGRFRKWYRVLLLSHFVGTGLEVAAQSHPGIYAID